MSLGFPDCSPPGYRPEGTFTYPPHRPLAWGTWEAVGTRIPKQESSRPFQKGAIDTGGVPRRGTEEEVVMSDRGVREGWGRGLG